MSKENSLGASFMDGLPLTGRYWSMAGAVTMAMMCEFFDFYIIAFVVGIISKPWHLTYGQSAAILLASGLGAIIGGMVWGWMGDRIGRRPALITSILLYSLGTGLAVFTPVGAWAVLGAFRVVVGAGVGAINSCALPIAVEFTPTEHRVVLGGLTSVGLIPLSAILSGLVAGFLGPAIGYKGLLLVGLIPVLVAGWSFWSVPESPRWLVSQGRIKEAENAFARIYGEGAVSTTAMQAAFEADSASPVKSGYLELLRFPRSFWSIVLIWFFINVLVTALNMWGPTLIAMVMSVKPAIAARFFIGTGIAGLVGRFGLAFLAKAIGRRMTGVVGGIGGAVFLVLSAALHTVWLGGLSVFYLLFVLTYIFADGQYTNLTPFSPEVWPAALRGHGVGLGQLFGGIGKVVGPVLLAVIAGSNNFIRPGVTLNVITPSFLVLACCSLVLLLVFLFIAPETGRGSLDDVSASIMATRKAVRSK